MKSSSSDGRFGVNATPFLRFQRELLQEAARKMNEVVRCFWGLIFGGDLFRHSPRIPGGPHAMTGRPTGSVHPPWGMESDCCHPDLFISLTRRHDTNLRFPNLVFDWTQTLDPLNTQKHPHMERTLEGGKLPSKHSSGFVKGPA